MILGASKHIACPETCCGAKTVFVAAVAVDLDLQLTSRTIIIAAQVLIACGAIWIEWTDLRSNNRDADVDDLWATKCNIVRVQDPSIRESLWSSVWTFCRGIDLDRSIGA